MSLSVHWLAPYPVQSLEAICGFNLASIRLRAGALATVAAGLGLRLTLGDEAPADAEVLVVGKISASDTARRHAAWIEQIRAARARGARCLLDYTDDHLAVESVMSPFYRDGIQHADACVASSRWLADSLRRVFAGPIHCIPDAIEAPCLPPKSRAGQPPSILWFGHPSNLGYLLAFLPRLAELVAAKLLILTSQQGFQMLQSSRLANIDRLVVQGALWSPQMMVQAAHQADLCIIPADPADPRKAGVSSNRLLTALALGLPTAADRVDSYRDFEPYFVDLRSAAMRELLARPLAWAEPVRQAQQQVLGGYTLEAVGRQWARLLGG